MGEPFDSLKDGEALTVERADWDVVGKLLGIDFAEYDGYDYYIAGRLQPIVFVKGNVEVDGNCGTDDIARGREGFDVEGDDWALERAANATRSK